MYPEAELTLLALKKRVLLEKISTRRENFSGQVEEVLRPLMWGDWFYAKWRELSPALKSMAAPLGEVMQQRLAPKADSTLGGVLRWVPLAFTFFRSIR